MSIQENIERIRREIDAAARETGRTGADITLVGASKMNDAAACQEAIAAGIDVLGENRVQEMTAKLAQHAYDGAPLHFIGHLQRNKVKQVVGKAALIQSVGSKELLDEIEKVAARMELVQDVLLEVNIGGEEAKSGFAPDALPESITAAPGAAYLIGTSYGQDWDGETAEYDICSRSNDSAPYSYSNLDTFRYQDGKLCSISIKVNWGEGTA